MATASFPSLYKSQVGPPQPQPNLSMVSYLFLTFVKSSVCDIFFLCSINGLSFPESAEREEA